jgi:hypothetical protein
VSITDSDTPLARRSDGWSSILVHAGHVLLEKRSGLVRLACTARASGTAERVGALRVIGRLRRAAWHRITLGTAREYDVATTTGALRAHRVTPHIARNDHPARIGKRRRSAIGTRTTRHPGYVVTQVIRSESRKPSVGSNGSRGWERHTTAATITMAGPSPWPPQPATQSGCPYCCDKVTGCEPGLRAAPRRLPRSTQTNEKQRLFPEALFRSLLTVLVGGVRRWRVTARDSAYFHPTLNKKEKFNMKYMIPPKNAKNMIRS